MNEPRPGGRFGRTRPFSWSNLLLNALCLWAPFLSLTFIIVIIFYTLYDSVQRDSTVGLLPYLDVYYVDAEEELLGFVWLVLIFIAFYDSPGPFPTASTTWTDIRAAAVTMIEIPSRNNKTDVSSAPVFPLEFLTRCSTPMLCHLGKFYFSYRVAIFDLFLITSLMAVNCRSNHFLFFRDRLIQSNFI